MQEDGTMAALPKKEQLKLKAELEKLEKNLTGIREMNALPGAVFIVDTKRETIAVAEARRLKIPIIGIVDTNCDPDEVDFVIPGNDDAIRSVSLICNVIARAAEEGRNAFQTPKVSGEQPEPPKVVAEVEVPAQVAEAEPAEAAAAPAKEAAAQVAPGSDASGEPVPQGTDADAAVQAPEGPSEAE
jgi:small subunit ribosomal protein S2